MLPLFGLAPGGVYHAAPVAGARGALLPHPFTLTCPLSLHAEKAGGFLSVALSLKPPPEGVRFAGRYPAPFFHGARTFLTAR